MSLFNTPKPVLEDILDYENIPVPSGKRVRSTMVIDHDGTETVRIELEDVPVQPPVTLSYALVIR